MSNPTRVHIAVDVGGTQIRAACYPPDSLTPLELNRIPTQAEGATPIERLTTLITSIWPKRGEVTAIGIAAPGPINPYEGILYTAPNIPGWNNLPLSRLLRERFGVPVFLGNDANLAALGEWRFGAGQGHHHLVYMTVSTGIGTGAIMDDQLVLGAHGLAMELGHTTIIPDGPLCGCGQRGHLEALASGPAIAHWVEQELAHGAASSLSLQQNLTTKEIAAAAQQGDELARRAFERAGNYIGIALANFVHILNPTIIVIGGGVSFSGELLFAPIRATLRERVLSPQYLEDLTIKPAALGDDAGLMGALALARGSS